MALVFSTHPLHPDVTRRLQAASDYRVASSPTASAILAEGTGAEVLIVRTNVPPEYFARAVGLRAAVRHGAGLDMVPMAAATAVGVLVANVPGANASTVAEHAIFAAIALLRRYRAVDSALRRQGWAAARGLADNNRDLGGRVLGILGYGNIGQALHRMAQGMGMKVIAHTRRPAALPPDMAAVSFADLLARSDVLVVCCPLTEATRGLIDAGALAAMKPDAVLINVARGPIIVTDALVAALARGHLWGAALDVFDEQPLAPEHPLFALPNVMLTPHVAGITEDSMLRMGQGTADEVLRILDGHLPLNFCNPEVEPAYRARFPAR
jgi:D-3-phosphoglycerate dehydrogenase